MAEAPFPFMRATFYRWLQRWHEVCPDLVKAPSVLAGGGLHLENFGAGGGQEGRLIWGVNDLGEAWPAAYTLDLLRLTTSAYLAIWAEHLSLTRREGAEAIEEGYRDALRAGGKPLVLAEHHPSNWRPCPANGTKSGCFTAWDGRRRTCISAAGRRLTRYGEIWHTDGDAGCTRRQRECSKPPSRTGKSGATAGSSTQRERAEHLRPTENRDRVAKRECGCPKTGPRVSRFARS